MERYFYVLAGAALGGLARYIVFTFLTARFPSKLPVGTMLINITGCFLIGLLMPLVVDKQNLRLLIVTGMLGGYTTFSSFMWEAFASASIGEQAIALANVVISIVAGYIAVWCGALITRR